MNGKMIKNGSVIDRRGGLDLIRRKIAELMRGRYGSFGIDRLNAVLLICGFVLYFVSLFFWGGAVHFVLIGLETASYAFFVFRMFSRNFAARQKENAAFLSFLKKIKSFFKLQKDRIKDFKKYRYRKCPHCKAVLRLPAKRGMHTVKCPKCGERFDVRNVL